MIIAFNHAPQKPRGAFGTANIGFFGFPAQGSGGIIPVIIVPPTGGAADKKRLKDWQRYLNSKKKKLQALKLEQGGESRLSQELEAQVTEISSQIETIKIARRYIDNEDFFRSKVVLPIKLDVKDDYNHIILTNWVKIFKEITDEDEEEQWFLSQE